MSDSGFVDEAPRRQRRLGSARPDRTGASASPSPEPMDQRRSRGPVAFLVVLLALLGFGVWAWSARVHADDEDAYSALVTQVETMDRTLVPLGHGEQPPCREPVDGLVTRTYPPSTGPQAAEMIGYLTANGWTRQASATAAAPAAPASQAFAHLVRTQAGHTLTIDLTAASESSLVESLTAHSPASSFGCLLR